MRGHSRPILSGMHGITCSVLFLSHLSPLSDFYLHLRYLYSRPSSPPAISHLTVNDSIYRTTYLSTCPTKTYTAKAAAAATPHKVAPHKAATRSNNTDGLLQDILLKGMALLLLEDMALLLLKDMEILMDMALLLKGTTALMTAFLLMDMALLLITLTTLPMVPLLANEGSVVR